MFDVTYLGFASGDIDRDAYGLRRTVSDGNNVAFCQSFSKNFGLYGKRERVCVLVITLFRLISLLFVYIAIITLYEVHVLVLYMLHTKVKSIILHVHYIM